MAEQLPRNLADERKAITATVNDQMKAAEGTVAMVRAESNIPHEAHAVQQGRWGVDGS